ncbi:D(1A) dopamine receptor-like [Paramacrobiotus metropolitanus]|uniref:D(1A) dopamine receptor-like n=1 Tax=Paramacrobiotus metropolitanus TaxID=2943436 RepID=UPI002445E44D|nr:D(1A) dopamine receptor-like [Paramacrobiotus metropolitanus]
MRVVTNYTEVEWSNLSAWSLSESPAKKLLIPIWTIDSVFDAIIAVLAFIFNVAVLAAIATRRSLTNAPFSVYQMHLTLVNALYVVIHDPLHIISVVDGVWWMGDALCDLYQYAVHVICAATTHTHMLISISRIWAVMFPFSYRRRHSTTLALAFCTGMWIYLNALLLPRNVLDWLYYRLPLLEYGCVTNFVAFMLNATVLSVIFTQRSLRSKPFSVYQMHLTLVNVLCVLLHDPLHIMAVVDGIWWMGDISCNIYQYSVHIIWPATTHTHLLISVNRIWAMLFPFSYRRVHSATVAVVLCLVMWLYLHALLLPRNILDALYYRRPVLENGCNMNVAPQRTLSIVLQFICFDMPAIIIIGSYPYVFLKHLSHRAGSTTKVKKTESRNCVPVNTNLISPMAAPTSITGREEKDVAKASTSPIKTGRQTHGFLVLSLLTVSVLICWAPLLTYYSILQFVSFDVSLLLKSANILYNLQLVTDPVILVFAQSSLRNACGQKLRRYHR